MRTEQEQLVDLQNMVIKGMIEIRRKRLLKYAYPIVLEGIEGVIIRNILELIAAGDKDKPDTNIAGHVSFEKSPVFCSREFPLPSGDMNPFL